MATASNEFEEQYFIGTMLLVAGVGSGIIGWPLLLMKINFFWVDIAYIVIPVVSYIWVRFYDTEEMSTFSFVVVFLGLGMLLAGISHVFRRFVAFQVELKNDRTERMAKPFEHRKSEI